MPKYRLSAFEYECTLLREFIKVEKRECERLEICKDLYDPHIFDSLTRTHLSLVESYNEKLIPLEDKLDEFRNAYTPDDKYFDDAPLEYLYQKFLNENLHVILCNIEVVYENTVNEVLNSSEFMSKRKAKKIVSHLMRSTILGHTVERYIAQNQFKELRSHPCYIKGSIDAIEEKYKYFMDRLKCCNEIGNKLIELERY